MVSRMAPTLIRRSPVNEAIWSKVVYASRSEPSASLAIQISASSSASSSSSRATSASRRQISSVENRRNVNC